ncbi:ABC transporter permease [bacterium]|nr:ABC transporter permease [bacterium]
MKVTVIKPKRSIFHINWQELWEYRELFVVLALKEFQIRYKQTVIGVLWALIRPLLTMVVFTFLFGQIAKLPSQGVPYPVFSYAGILLWSFFSTAITQASSSMTNNSKLITKIYFPRIIIPASTTIVSLIDYLIAFGIIFGLAKYFDVPITSSVIYIIPALFGTWLLSLGVSFIFAASNVKYRDIQYALPFIIQMLMYATPVIYPVTFAGKYDWILKLNPMSGLIEMHRAAILGLPIDWPLYALSMGVTLVVFLGGYFYFKSVERYFADLI